MRNIKILTLFFSLLFVLVSCEEKEFADYTAPDSLNDAGWLLGLQAFATDPYSINQDSGLSFFNLSQGTVTQEWILEEGNSYLRTGFDTNDSLPLFIRKDVGLTLSEAKAHVFFGNSGINTVRLVNKFDKPTSPNISDDYPDNVIVDEYTEDGLYVVDTKFVFDVYAHLEPAFTVLKDDVPVLTVTEEDMPLLADSDSWPTVEIEAATGLKFVDNTTIGRPNSRTWFAPDGVPNRTGGLEPIIKFYRLGTFNAGTMRSLRINELPKSQTDKIIPLKVKVVKSTQPFVFDGVLKEDKDEVISFRVNGEVQAFTGEEDNFTVHVTNSTTGFDQDIPVQSVRVSEDDSIFIQIILSAPIYNSDVVTVSYNGNGNIKSADDRSLEAFEPKTVEMHFGNSILPARAHASFEQGNGAANNAFAVKYFTGNNNILGGGNFAFERVTNRFYPGDGGSASMKWSTPESNPLPNVNLWSFGLGEPEPIPAGTYVLSYYLYIEPGTTLKTFRTEFNKPEFSRQIWTGIDELPKGEWVKVTHPAPFTTGEITPAMNLRLTFRPHAAENAGVTGAQVMYIDNFSMVEVEPRL